MVCSFGDQNDVSVFRELGLTPFQAIDLEGKITDIGGPLAGLPVIEASKKALEILEESDRIENIEERDQEIPVSERGKNPIEIILLKEWYVRQTHIQERLKELSDEINLGSYTYIHNQNLLIDKDKKKFSLTTKENELLKLFCLNINNKVERNAALIKIWGDDSYYNARSMDVYIAKLRKYLKEDNKIDLKTIHGFGFKLLILD